MKNEMVVGSSTHLNWTPEQIHLLKETVCVGATDDEFKIFCHVVKKTGLDPFMKQIHAVKRWNAKKNREDMSFQVGIDGYRLIADRTGLYAGSDEPHFDHESNPQRASVTVYKIVQGMRCSFTATARWTEYYPGDKQGFMWKKMPCVMLGKVAEALALRKAFPADLSGLYTKEEMEQADREVEVVQHPSDTPKIAADVVAEAMRLKGIQTRLSISKEDLENLSFDRFQTRVIRSLSAAQMKALGDELENMAKPQDLPVWDEQVITDGPK